MQSQPDPLPCLRGLITDQDLEAAEVEFPGISRFYAGRRGCDRTFLDLLAAYLDANASVREH